MEADVSKADGYQFSCKLCGKSHEVPEEVAPYWQGNQKRHILLGEVPLSCAEKPGTAQYSEADFTPYKVTG